MSRLVRPDLRISSLVPWLRTRRSWAKLSVTSANSPQHNRSSNLTPKFSHFSSMPQARQDAASTESPGDAEAKFENDSMKEIKAPEGKLAIVFTDIVKSTYIWEHEPTAMKEAMAMHDDMIRSLTVRHRGYEVKQNGDGFMVAFQSAMSALEFCLEVQEQLLDMSWPGKLLKLGAGSEVKAKENKEDEPEVLFKGLRLRMSCHWGEPVSIWNKTIGRMDYIGPVVNRAARFIQATEGGQIVVSEAFLEALGTARSDTPDNAEASAGPLFAMKTEQDEAEDSDEDAVGQMFDLKDLRAEHTESLLRDKQFEVRLLGKRHFKGVSDDQKLYFIIPQSLHGRLQFWPRHMHVAGSKGNLVGPD